MKKKLRKWIIGVIVSVLPWLLVIILVLSGLNAVVSFFKNLFSWGKKKDIDINNCSIEQLIEAVDDKKIFTKKVLEEMMIDRKSLKYLLTEVHDYNNRSEAKTISVELTVTYTVEEEREIEDNENDTGEEAGNNEGDLSSGKETKTEKVLVTHTEDRYYDVIVSNDFLIRNYEMDWQTIYIMCIFKSMANYDNWVPGEKIYDENGNEIELEPEMLSESDIDEIINDFKFEFIYNYNVVEGPASYSKDDVLSVPHFPYATTKVEDGITYYIQGNIPMSELSMVKAPAFIDVYSSMSTYSLKDEFIMKANKYYDGFNIAHYFNLMKELPKGKEVANRYKYLFNLPKWEGEILNE